MIKYSHVKKWLFKLEADYEVAVDFDVDCDTGYISLDKQTLKIKKNYCWDGSSIPFKKILRFASLGIYNADRYCKEASLVHDAFCQLIREGLMSMSFKYKVDMYYRNMCILGGLSVKRADFRFEKLRKYGDKFVERDNRPRNKIYET